MTGKNPNHSTNMERRNFLGVLSGVGVAPVWNKLRTTNTSRRSETDTEPPLVVDRFHAGTDYNKLTIGNIGAGKSYTTKMQLVKDMRESESGEEEQMAPVIGNSAGGKSYNAKVNLAKQMSGAELPEKNQNPLDIQT
jgi:hypothetical protein